MQTEHQDFRKEFPELEERIETLERSSSHFAKLLAEFAAITAEIERVERNDLASGDPVLLARKKHRLAVKDELYALLGNAHAASGG